MARLLVGILCLFLDVNGQAPSRGRETADPESISGRWETSDGQGGAVGMNIMLTIAVSGGQASFSPFRQVEPQLTIGLFQRTGADVGQLGFNFFTSSSDGGANCSGRWQARQRAGSLVHG
jgi:hypothetical protein